MVVKTARSADYEIYFKGVKMANGPQYTNNQLLSPMINQGLLGQNPAQTRANAFLAGLGGMSPGLLMAGSPSTDPNNRSRGLAMAFQGFQQAQQNALDRARLQNLQNLQLQQTQRTAALAAQKQKGLDQLAKKFGLPPGTPETVIAKVMQPRKIKDSFMSIPGLGIADLDSGIVYTGQGQFNLGPKTTAAIARSNIPKQQAPSTSGTSQQRETGTQPNISQQSMVQLSPKAQEDIELARLARERDPTKAEIKVDENFAKVYIDYEKGGLADTEKQIGQLISVREQLKRSDNLTGPVIGLIPNIARPFLTPESLDVQETVEEVVQRNLKAILGAQFAKTEAEQLISRAYNPSLPEKVNAKRIGRLIDSMVAAAQSKQNVVDYYNKHRTLRGYRGKTSFSIKDIERDARLDIEEEKGPKITIKRIN